MKCYRCKTEMKSFEGIKILGLLFCSLECLNQKWTWQEIIEKYRN